MFAIEIIDSIERYSSCCQSDREQLRNDYPELSRAFDVIDYAEQRVLKSFAKDIRAINKTIEKIKTL